MGKVVNMANPKKAKRGPNPSGGVGGNDTSRTNFSYRLFFVVDLSTFAKIEWLRESLEAHSYGDVVRQAVRSFAIRIVEDETIVNGRTPNDDSPASGQQLKRLNIRVPAKTKDRLDGLKQQTDMSYTDIIVCGLEILLNKAEREEALLKSLGEKSNKEVCKKEELTKTSSFCNFNHQSSRAAI